MRLWRWLSTVSMLFAVVSGLVAGLGLGLFSDVRDASATGSFHVRVVSWRDHALPDLDPDEGSELPMFYTTDAEGECVSDPSCMPVGVWAPGDTWERVLVVRNISTNRAVRLPLIWAQLSGEHGLAPWFHLTVLQAGQELYSGPLSRHAFQLMPLSPAPLLQPGQLTHLTFRVHFNIDTDQRLQGTRLEADFLIAAQRETCAHTGCAMVIDILPNTWPNQLDPRSKSKVPVAVNGSATLDVRTLRVSSAEFGPDEASAAQSSIDDWNGDGYDDLVLRFPIRETGIECGMTSAALTIRDENGELYRGSDAIVTTGCQ